MKTLFITDLDGTLLKSDKTISAKSCEILNRLISEGVAFSYATARSIYSSSVLTKEIDFRLPLVTKNGAIIQNPDWSILHENKFTKEEVEGGKHILDGSVHYFTTIGTKEELWKAYEELDGKYRSICAKDTYSEDYWLEFMPKHATKADAVMQLKKLLGFDKVVVFGDAVNDIPMFEIADECYAMENAVPELKNIATGIIGNNNEDGVAMWLAENYHKYRYTVDITSTNSCFTKDIF